VYQPNSLHPQADITARDGVTSATITSRKHDLLDFLRRHVVARETACWEETHRWKRAAGEPLLRPGERVAKKKTYDRAYQMRRKQARTGGTA
jgi:hypothetical protein